MCCGKTKCQKPKDLIGKPGKCSPEQIRKCHGDVEKHPCAMGAGKPKTTGR